MSSRSIMSEAYEEYCKSNNRTPRVHIREGLEELESHVRAGEPSVLFLNLPTAYGKTTLTMALARLAIRGNDLFKRVIHVLPMRSIADQLGNDVKRTVGSDHVAIQHMSSPESPFFTREVVITTLDTFLLNFYKAPAPEIQRVVKYGLSHFEFSRGLIYTSAVNIDEFHLFSPLGTREESAKSMTSACQAVVSLTQAGVPLIIMTATMPPCLKKFLFNEVSRVGARVIERRYQTGDDPSFDKRWEERQITTQIHTSESLVDVCRKELGSGKRVMVVLNSVKNAISTYRALSNEEPIFLHGKLPEYVRQKRTSRLNIDDMKDTPRLLIATQVVESGLNLSFDSLVTEACPADRLVQRAGRVARAEGHDRGEVHIIVGDEKQSGPYSPELIKKTVQELDSRASIDSKLIEQVYANETVNKDSELWDSLTLLDRYPIFDAADARNALKSIRGFTESFGIVSGYMSKKLQPGWAVGLSEEEAMTVFKTHRRLVRNGQIVTPEEGEARGLMYGSLSINLLCADYDGIVIDDFDPEIGYVKG